MGHITLRSLLEERTQMYPEKTFLLFENACGEQEELSYMDFQKRVTKLENALLDLGIQKGDHITLHLPNSIDFMVAWFAIGGIGAIMVPTNILSTSDEMEYILSHSESVLLMTEMEYIQKFEAVRNKLPLLQNILLTRFEGNHEHALNATALMEQASEKMEREIEISSDDIAGMLYTSGTTSKPKGVQVTHANYIFAGEMIAQSISLRPEDRQFVVLPLFHGNAQYYSTMSALIVGASVALTEKFSASRYFKQAKRLGATVGSLFAAPIRMILAQQYDLEDQKNSLRLIMFAQSVAEHQLDEFEQKFDIRLLQMYGMTETIGVPLINPIHGIRKNMSIGKPSIGYEVKIVDENGVDLPEGTVGQIAVRGVPGRTLMKGYFKNEEATKEALQNNWLLTGDNARIAQDGYFYFIDRMKDMIKRSGENVAANEVESVLVEHPDVYEVAVIGIPDEMRDEAIKAFVILNEGALVSEDILIEFCKLKLAKFKVPDEIEFVTAFPRTPVGKIQKHILRQSIRTS
ncbi:AMP-binding protein [Viridibacillus arvi]|uniref:AMP-binding protein n=1 Tax=Viridibacillus arvi TaxID=263475 RepID=UPI003D0504AF